LILKKHHVGLAVNDLDAEIAKYEKAGFKLGRRFTKPGMKAAMLFKDGTGAEFFEFENPDGELEQKIKRHTAYVSDDLEKDVQQFLDDGCELAIPIEKGTVVKRYAYVKDPAGNYIELLEPADDMPA
jgi:catechol 2,3-dioxygenase-like lactoylglutathione lyase family enzyme